MQYCLVQGTEGSKYTNLYFIFYHLSICYIQEQILTANRFIGATILFALLGYRSSQSFLTVSVMKSDSLG